MTVGKRNGSTREGHIVGSKYRLGRKLGEGGMGQVYEAVNIGIGRPVAIKLLHPFLASRENVVSRFQREAQSAGALVDPNIAAITDLGVGDDGAPFIVMELLDGADLSKLLARTGPFPVPRATYITQQVCRGLSAAHALGIVHRDLKPENLFICEHVDGSDLVKVLDFGIAKLRTGVDLTRTGAPMGTALYMSPEQARNPKKVDHRTDIYSLGVILYEMLSGAKPHPGEEYNDVVYHLLHDEPGPIESLRPGLPPGLPEVVKKAMSRKVEDRYASVGELMAALSPFADRRVTTPSKPVSAIETKPSPLSSPAVSVPASPPAGQNLSRRSTSNRRKIVISIAVILVVGTSVSVGAWMLGTGPKQMTEPSTAPVPASPSPARGEAPALAPEPTPVPPPTPPSAPAAADLEAAPAARVKSLTPRPAGRPGGRSRQTRSPSESGSPGFAKGAESRAASHRPTETSEDHSAKQPESPRIDVTNPYAE